MVTHRLQTCFRIVAISQFAIGLLSAFCVAWLYETELGIAIAFGSSLAILNTFISQRSMQRAGQLAYTALESSMLPVFIGLIQRLIIFAAGFTGGVIILKLSPLYLLIGFGLAQFGYLASMYRT